MKHYRNLILCAYFFQYLTSYKSISIEIGIDTYHSIAFFRIPHFRFYYFVSFISKSNVLIYIVAVHDGWMDGRTGDVCIGFTAFQRIVKDLRHGMDVVSLILVHFQWCFSTIETNRFTQKRKRSSKKGNPELYCSFHVVFSLLCRFIETILNAFKHFASLSSECFPQHTERMNKFWRNFMFASEFCFYC